MHNTLPYKYISIKKTTEILHKYFLTNLYSESLLFDGVMAPLKQIMIFMFVNVYYVYTCFVLEVMAEYYSQISDENGLFLDESLTHNKE